MPNHAQQEAQILDPDALALTRRTRQPELRGLSDGDVAATIAALKASAEKADPVAEPYLKAALRRANEERRYRSAQGASATTQGGTPAEPSKKAGRVPATRAAAGSRRPGRVAVVAGDADRAPKRTAAAAPSKRRTSAAIPARKPRDTQTSPTPVGATEADAPASALTAAAPAAKAPKRATEADAPASSVTGKAAEKLERKIAKVEAKLRAKAETKAKAKAAKAAAKAEKADGKLAKDASAKDKGSKDGKKAKT